MQYNSTSPVGFWSGKEPPKKDELTDVRAYNRRHGMMWILFGAGLVLCFLVGLPFGGSVAAILVGIECAGGIFGMVVYHNVLDRRYRRRIN